jgi:integrase
MPKKAKELGALEVKRLTEPGMYPVGGVAGLYLLVAPTGGRSWILRTKVGDKRREIGLGGFPDVSLSDARTRAKEEKQDISKGIDPIEKKREAKSTLKTAQSLAKTFKACATSYIDTHKDGWRNEKHAQQWTKTLEKYAYPVIGQVLVKDVNTAQIKEILDPIWKDKTETASRVRNRIELVLYWAQAMGFAPQGLNPARWRGHLDKLLPPPSKVATKRKQPAVKIEEVGLFTSLLRAANGIGPLALEFLMLTAVRSSNVRAMTWKEVDFDAETWTILESRRGAEGDQRMKTGKEHRVPLSPRAIEILKSLPGFDDKNRASKTVFPAPRGGQLSDMAFSSVMRTLAYKDKHGDICVPHGLRSTFKDWASERTAYPEQVSEMALAHSIGDKVEAAYRRGDLFDKRRQMMDDWAKFCSVIEQPGKVLPLKQKPAA